MTTRRDFLKFGAAAAAVTGLSSTPQMLIGANTYGRILSLVEARKNLQADAPVTVRLLPDSVQQILVVEDGWVLLPQGYVPASAIQKMKTPNGQPIRELPAQVEVIAPYAAVRQWASIEAPLITRLDHAVLLWAVYALDDQRGKIWLQVEFDLQQSGWVQRVHLQPFINP